MLSMWPTYLRLETIATGLRTLDIQAWLLENSAPVARIQCAPDTDSHDFDELIESLRERKSVRRRGIHRDCLSRIGRSRLCDGRPEKKAPSAALFWRRFMGPYSVRHSSPLTYLSFRWPHCSSHKLGRTSSVASWNCNLH